MATESSGCLFIQFAREPVAGTVKTRMIPHLTPQEACSLHCELVYWTAATLVAADLGRVELAVAGDASHLLFRRCLELGVQGVTTQHGADLGERMRNAIEVGLRRFGRVILVGSDCPSIDSAYLAQALAGLDEADTVLGPAEDGGYVSIGVRQACPDVFTGISWGAASVLRETRLRLRRLGVPWVELPTLVDIDRPEELAIWATLRDAGRVKMA